jgi:hypothetical protein
MTGRFHFRSIAATLCGRPLPPLTTTMVDPRGSDCSIPDPGRITLPVPHPPWLTPSRYRGFPALLPDMAGHPGKDDPSLLRGPYGINGDILRSKTLVYYFITLLHSHYPVFFPFWGFAGITHAHALPPLTTTHVRTNRTRCRHGGGASPGAMFCFFYRAQLIMERSISKQ